MLLILTENDFVRVKDLNKNKLCSCYGRAKTPVTLLWSPLPGAYAYLVQCNVNSPWTKHNFIALTQANHSMIHMAIKASGLGSGTKKIALFSLGNTH